MPVAMSTTRASSTTSPPSMASEPTIIFWMPSVSATSISLSPRRSRRKSIFSREKTRSRGDLAEERVQAVARVVLHPAGDVGLGAHPRDPDRERLLRRRRDRRRGRRPRGRDGGGRRHRGHPEHRRLARQAPDEAAHAGDERDADDHQDERTERARGPGGPRAGARLFDPELVHPHLVPDVLERLRPEVVKREGDAVADGAVDVLRHGDAAGTRDGLQAGRDVDAVAQDLGAGAHDFAEVDPDADADRVAGGARGPRELGLDRDRRLDRIHGAVEEGDEAVADQHVERPAVPGDHRREDVTNTHERRDRTCLVLPHEAAEAGHVGEEDRLQAA